jgi:hypothetical protein
VVVRFVLLTCVCQYKLSIVINNLKIFVNTSAGFRLKMLRPQTIVYRRDNFFKSFH